VLFDADRSDPEIGYRFLASEAAAAGEVMRERTYHRRRRQARLGCLTPIEYETTIDPTVSLAT